MYDISYIWYTILNLFGYTRKQPPREKQAYEEIDTINFTDIFANSLKNMIITDSTIQVLGESERARTLEDGIQRLRRKLGKITSFVLGYGGCVVVPYVANNKLYFNIVQQANMAINKISGDDIVDCVILADRFVTKDSNTVYYRFVRYALENATLVIQNVARKGSMPCQLSEVSEWASIPDELRISGVERVPFAYFKCPKDNRKDVQLYGVPITFGAEEGIAQAKECMNQLISEFGYKQARIFVDKVLFSKRENQTGAGVPSLLSKEYVTVMSGNSADPMLEVYSPDIRDTSYYNRLLNLFALIEKQVGTSAGILTPLQSTHGATATEIRASLQDTFALVSDIRDEIERGLDDYIYACNVLLNYYGVTVQGTHELSVTWSYALVESSEESFNQLVVAQSIGAVSKAEIRQYIFDHETMEEAEKKIEEIEAKEPTLSGVMGIGDTVGA